MELVLTRKTFTEKSAVGELSVDAKFECYTLEDKVRKEKIAKVTAIPYGRFRVQITYSPRFKVQRKRDDASRIESGAKVARLR